MPKLEGAKMWVVLPREFEHIGDCYFNKNYAFGKPMGCFTIKEMAEEFAKVEGIKYFKSVICEEFFSGYLYDYPVGAEADALLDKYDIDPGNFQMAEERVEALTDADCKLLMEFFEIGFFSVQETDIYC